MDGVKEGESFKVKLDGENWIAILNLTGWL